MMESIRDGGDSSIASPERLRAPRGAILSWHRDHDLQQRPIARQHSLELWIASGVASTRFSERSAVQNLEVVAPRALPLSRRRASIDFAGMSSPAASRRLRSSADPRHNALPDSSRSNQHGGCGYCALRPRARLQPRATEKSMTESATLLGDSQTAPARSSRRHNRGDATLAPVPSRSTLNRRESVETGPDPAGSPGGAEACKHTMEWCFDLAGSRAGREHGITAEALRSGLERC
jgi:hypothetical protein